MSRSLPHFLQRLRRQLGLELFYHPAFRFPISSLSTGLPIEPRRADFVAWYLVRQGVLRAEDVHAPRPVSYEKLARVHGQEYLESLHDATTLGRIFGVDPSDVPVAEVLRTIRLGCGATVAAARRCLTSRRAALNLLGGFHHAGPRRGGGLCAVNDVAVALADVREHGFTGQAVVLDLDAHPPDGTAECLRGHERVWIGSLSGSDWGALPGVRERVLPEATGDQGYLEALDGLLGEMPKPELAFVIAGGDVLAGDAFGRLALPEDGARERDRRVFEALRGCPSVWLPGGAYQPRAWRVLAGTGLVLAGRTHERIRPEENPLREHFAQVARSLSPRALTPGDEDGITEDEVNAQLGYAKAAPRLLGFYTADGVEYALERYGFLAHLRRLGYRDFEVQLDDTPTGQRMRLWGEHRGERHMLVDVVADRRVLHGREYLFVNWLALRNPVARFSPERPRLPGQEVPGLGLSREAAELLARIAKRLELAGVAFRPAHFHVAYAARHDFRFVDPVRQGRFEALVRDLGGLPLLEATRAVSEGRVLLDGSPYAWEADDMIDRAAGALIAGEEATRAERERAHFVLRSPSAEQPHATV